MLLSVAFAQAHDQGPDLPPPATPHFSITDVTHGPHGYEGFCSRKPEICYADFSVQKNAAMYLTPEKEDQLNRVNLHWNTNVVFLSDQDAHRVTEFWDIAMENKPADCEDVARAKLERLARKYKFPRESLMLLVGRDEKGEGHLVLGIMTSNKGLLIADNLTNDILPWHQSKITFTTVLAERGQWRAVVATKPEPSIATIIQATDPSDPWAATVFNPDHNAIPAVAQGAGRFAQPRLDAKKWTPRGSILK